LDPISASRLFATFYSGNPVFADESVAQAESAKRGTHGKDEVHQ
jgi:hypothetical protein